MSGSSWSSHSSQNQPSSTSSLTFPWSRGRPKTGWRRRIVIKEDLVAEDLQSAAGELLSRALLLVLLMKIVSWSLVTDDKLHQRPLVLTKTDGSARTNTRAIGHSTQKLNVQKPLLEMSLRLSLSPARLPLEILSLRANQKEVIRWIVSLVTSGWFSSGFYPVSTQYTK